MKPAARSALFLDFDSVFSELLQRDPKAALRFAEEPTVWLDRLSVDSAGQPSRRWLVLRCYLAPAGSVRGPKDALGRLHFSTFRRHLTDAGFEMVDCPPLSHTKNAADIRIVIDALDALHVQPRYDEFVLMSGDSDIAPLIFRLRALDRRITVISPSDSAEAVGASADQLITGEALRDLLSPHAPGAEAERPSVVRAPLAVERQDVVERVQRALKLPALTPETWRSLYEVLGTFAGSHEFSISEATRWSHDQLAANGVDVSRQIVGMVIRGAATGGRPLYHQPPPDAGQIADAFVRSVIDRAGTAGLNLSVDDTAEVRACFGVTGEA